ncbi:tyrosine-protein phosphatase [Sphaerisporangium aureirubrum]|uniref:Tyrosine-protein phosphatase n=1 Tax=Sphaerisporangium aureirubrum TaxID=1544736 RepID=A0ABW1NBW6_9ACTN
MLPQRHITFTRLHNFRDVGGYPTGDGGTVRWGRLYRSDGLYKLEGEDWERFRELGVRTVIDLRYPFEIEARGRVPEDDRLAYHNLSIEHRPYDQPALGPHIDPGPFLAERYAEVAEDGVKELRQALEIITADGNAPVVIHCASGKDRTGILTALVLSLLGVAEDDIVADFALTELATARLLADHRAAGGATAPVWPGYGRAPRTTMRLFLDDLTHRHGSVRAYAAERLGADEALVTALRRQLTAR